MNSLVFILVVVIGSCISANASSDSVENHQVILEEAMNRIRDDYVDYVAFKEVVKRGIERIERIEGEYDPRRLDQPWILTSINGSAPNKLEIEKYSKDKRKQVENLEKHPERSPLGVKAMVRPGSLKLIDDGKQRWLFSFTPTGEDQKLMRKMKGKLSINKEGRYLEWMDVRSENPFKANLVTKLKEFIMHYEFEPLAKGKGVVPTSFEFRINLAAIGVIEVDEHLFAKYSDYRSVND